MPHTLPKLPWDIAALEPNYLKSTMEFHYGKHHNTYVTKLNAALEGTGHENVAIEELLTGLKTKDFPADKRQAVINHGGGHYNHTLFWNILGPNSTEEPSGELAEQINKDFGSFTEFKEKFATNATNLFGSGWTWLTVKKDGSLQIENTANQDNCLMDSDRKPILVLDVWEHAYYLEHQNLRPNFITTFWKMVNWKQVAEYYSLAKTGKTIINLDTVAV
jgi:Fe-Mn family superoxide dismutase